MLKDADPMGFLAVSDFARARTFYESVLGLEFVSQDEFAMVLRSGPIFVRLAKPEPPVIAPYTVFGWRVRDIHATASELARRGAEFARYPHLSASQDETGVWTAPNGDKVAWFSDPDGNLLSISQHMR